MQCEIDNYTVFIFNKKYSGKYLKVYPKDKDYYFTGKVDKDALSVFGFGSESFKIIKFKEVENTLQISVDSFGITLDKKESPSIKLDKIIDSLDVIKLQNDHQFENLSLCTVVSIFLTCLSFIFLLIAILR